MFNKKSQKVINDDLSWFHTNGEAHYVKPLITSEGAKYGN